jgi:hypothetical protein
MLRTTNVKEENRDGLSKLIFEATVQVHKITAAKYILEKQSTCQVFLALVAFSATHVLADSLPAFLSVLCLSVCLSLSLLGFELRAYTLSHSTSPFL